MSSKLPEDTAPKPITVKDIARLTGTSASTVSRVLTGVVPVKPSKREAILKAIADVNYRPNLLARSLKTRSTHTIGLLINDILNPFYSALARGVEDKAGEVGYSVVFCNTNEDPSKELRYLSILEDKSVDGVILAPTGGNRDAMARLISGGAALVQVDRRIPDIDAPSVTVDNEAGAYEAAKHLIAVGHDRIALITYAMRQMSVAEREIGFRKAIDESQAPHLGKISYVGFDLADVESITRQLLASSAAPTAIIAANNRIALAVMRAMKALDLRAGIDIAMVVFDDIDIFEIMTPSITAVRQPAYEMGAKAAELLLTQLAPKAASATQSEIFAPQLIVRESSQTTPKIA